MSAFETLSHPTNAADVTPDDSDDLPTPGVLYVGTTGDVKVDTVGGSTVTFQNHPVGYMPVPVRRVYSTGTTASDMLVLYGLYD